MIEEINKKISEEVDIHNPYIVMKKIEQLSALMSNVVLLASDTKRSFDIARKVMFDDGIIKKSDTSSHVESLLSEEAYARDYCAGLKQAMQIRITSLQSILSYLKSELDAQR
jgi:hypothetical protein